jgi:hypothetical protein
MAETFQLSGIVVTPTVTTTPALLALPDGCTGFIVCNPDTTNSVFIHPVPKGASAPTAAVNLRGIRVYPGTNVSAGIAAEGAFGADIYVCTNASTITINAYGVI